MGASYDIVLLDIEGTTTPISFVHDVLFPYVTNNAKEFLEQRWTDPEVQKHVRAIAEQANKDVDAGIVSAVPVDLGSVDLSQQSTADVRQKVLANIEWQMKADRKIGALKGLQGYMWRFGYEDGQLKGVMYDDAVDAIRRWTENNCKVYIYSSGSVEAQKLIFGHSDHGDLLPYISGHYDTRVGSKLEASSYTTIANDIGLAPERILFVSDNIDEIRAADCVGMQTVVSFRPGNASIDDIVKFKTTENFMDIPL
ncbi:enolase-phosphatase E1 [Coemansia sp. RSA 1813]|nr:enolase-phosphatase E1 [Coemansia sp. RSA 1646]KAJ1765825.1 enolase-phosphatase E1 [Coemansia sp. RSA 1843]KAJ2085497.1 enolase-phosphatase E1 [Coemansia sp. RSA 986]KAJ2217822.1 enolase-phosphatase E1 [Coemansia sp. RSA 487]KAJ2562735.1 enolase-phosphatase E1 [Coemansia sp. RSA 1813]